MKAIERELELTTRALLASENWAPAYANAPKQHAALIKLTAKLHRQTVGYLRDLAKHAPEMINWYEYRLAVTEQQRSFLADSVIAYNVNVVINNDSVSQSDQQFIKVVFDTVAAIMSEGADSTAEEAGLPFSLNSTASIIQQLTTDQLANLVGMKVNKDGTIVPNPNTAYNIDETTRSRIAQSIKTSIQLGEDHTDAVKRLQDVIADADRADLIAYTESVRAYAEGRAEYARQSNATFKVWSDNNAIDICADNTAEGPIPIDADFVSGDPNEPAHPRCLVGGTVVSSTTIKATSERFYEGDVITIRTANGNKLTVTPNHPILTSKGWIAAGELHEGADLLSCVDAEGVTSAIDPNDYNVPAKIEQIIESFERTLPVMSVTVPTTSKDFHGDGIDGQVAVINSDGLLRGRSYAELVQPRLHKQLGGTDMKLFTLNSLCMLQLGLEGIRTTTLSSVSRFRQQLTLFSGHFAHANVASVASIPNADLVLSQDTIDGHAANPKSFSQLLNGLTGKVKLDKIISVFEYNLLRIVTPKRAARTDSNATRNKRLFTADIRHASFPSELRKRFTGNIALDKIIDIKWERFSGHVYNLETATGWYIANGIITHNCKCLTTYLYADTLEEAKAQWDS